MKEIHLSV